MNPLATLKGILRWADGGDRTMQRGNVRIAVPRPEAPIQAAFRRGWELGLFRALTNVQDQLHAIREESVRRNEAYRQACLEAEKPGELARLCKHCKKPEGAHTRHPEDPKTSEVRYCEPPTERTDGPCYEPSAPEPTYVAPPLPEPLTFRMDLEGPDGLRAMLEALLRDCPKDTGVSLGARRS